MTFRRILIAGGGLVVVSLVIVKVREHLLSSLTHTLNSPAASPAVSARPTGNIESKIGGTPRRQIVTAPPPRGEVEGQPALTAPTVEELSTTDRSPLANRLGTAGTKPEAEPGIVLDILKTYRRLFGMYPAGEGNREFVNALLGANREKLPLLPSDHPRINSQGEIVDAWGTPFFFHQNSRNWVEVRSAGEDHLFYTKDDIVAGAPPATLGESLISDDELRND